MYKKTTGVAQFSTFGGWQIASNALFMYAHMPIASTGPIPDKFKTLHGITVKLVDSLKHAKERPDDELGIYYLWDKNAPLKRYMAQRYAHDTIPYEKQWAMIAPFYNQYGTWLIKQHPDAFARYYLLPNLENYYLPRPEFLAIDNMYTDTVEQGAVTWFRYKTNKVTARSKDRKIILTSFFPAMLARINIAFFLLIFLAFPVLSCSRSFSPYYKKVLFTVLLVCISNLVFSVFASPIVFRYQIFPFIITSAFNILMVDVLWRNFSEKKSIQKDQYSK